MKNINWGKGLGFGALIWLIMFAFVSFLVGFSFYDSLVAKIITVLLAGVLSYVFALNMKLHSISHAFIYGFMWVAIGAVLDLLISTQFNPTIFSTWEYWVGAVLILSLPTFSISDVTESKTINISHAL